MPLTEKELDLIKKHLSKENAAKATLENGLSLLDEQMTALSKLSLDQAEALKAAEGKALSTIEMDPDTLETAVELIETKMDGLVKSGAITPAVQKALSSILIGNEGSRNVYALSRKASGGAKSFASQVIEALSNNKPVKLREKTGAQQQVELSRADDQAAEAQQKEIFDIMASGFRQK